MYKFFEGIVWCLKRHNSSLVVEYDITIFRISWGGFVKVIDFPHPLACSVSALQKLQIVGLTPGRTISMTPLPQMIMTMIKRLKQQTQILNRLPGQICAT
jgi:hypothetical protein